MIKKHTRTIALAAMLSAAPVLALASGMGGDLVVSESGRATATVVDLQDKERKIRLRDEQGAEFEVVAGDEVRNFAQIKKGDVVEVEYFRAAASALEKASDANVAGTATEVQRAPAGAKPGVQAMHTSTIVADVMAIDAAQRLLTVKGPMGGIVTLKVPAEMKAFDSLKAGDKISAVYTEALAVSVKSPTK